MAVINEAIDIIFITLLNDSVLVIFYKQWLIYVNKLGSSSIVI